MNVTHAFSDFGAEIRIWLKGKIFERPTKKYTSHQVLFLNLDTSNFNLDIMSCDCSTIFVFQLVESCNIFASGGCNSGSTRDVSDLLF